MIDQTEFIKKLMEIDKKINNLSYDIYLKLQENFRRKKNYGSNIIDNNEKNNSTATTSSHNNIASKNVIKKMKKTKLNSW